MHLQTVIFPWCSDCGGADPKRCISLRPGKNTASVELCLLCQLRLWVMLTEVLARYGDLDRAAPLQELLRAVNLRLEGKGPQAV